MSRERRCWTPQEDELLREAVAEEDPDNPNPSRWHAIAMHVPGRSNKDCRKRWISKMASNVSKGVWAPDEDERLIAAVQKYGASRWAMVATMVKTRNSDQCAKRWMDTLDPSIDRTSWTAEADAMLLYAVECHGKSWAKIVRTYFPGRTGLAAKNRYNSITRSRGSDSRQNRNHTVPLFDPLVYPKTASSSSSSPSPTLSMPRLPAPSPPLKPTLNNQTNSSNLYFDDILATEQWTTTANFPDDSYSSESWMRSSEQLWSGDNLFQPRQQQSSRVSTGPTSYPFSSHMANRMPPPPRSTTTSSGLNGSMSNPNVGGPQNGWAPLDPRIGNKNFGLYQL